MTAYRPQRVQPRRRGPGVLAIVVVVIVALAIGFVLGNLVRDDGGGVAGGSGSPLAGSASPSGSASVAASASAAADAGGSAGPSPVVAAPGGLIPPGSVARVTVDGLRIREGPSTDAATLDQLPVGQLVAVGFAPTIATWGPTDADGFAWYPVRRLADLTELPALPESVLDLEGDDGWAAASDGETPFLELVPPRCPSRPVDLATLEAMQPWESLACFGTEQITFEGVFGCGGCGGAFPGTYAPEWLAHPLNFAVVSVDPNERMGPLALRFPPDGPAMPDPASIIRVTGHFDDAASSTCEVAPGEEPTPLEPAVAELYCREQFVVESLEVTGTDSDFPFG
jgi:hypothetical protein